jgi:drug/metabolite transporter (DMT)-like permease
MAVAGVVLDGADSLDPTAPSTHSLLALGYLVVAGAAAFSAYVWALRNLPISTVVSHQYVNPAVAVLLGAVLLGESLDASSIIGAALVIAAVFATVRSDASPAPIAEEVVPEPRR